MHSSWMCTVCSSGHIRGSVCSGRVSALGVSVLGGVCSQMGGSAPGGCLLWGVSALGEECLLWVVSAPGEVCLGVVSALGRGVCRGMSATRGGRVCSRGMVPALRQKPPSPCGQTDACKNITFATSLRTVNIPFVLVQNHLLCFLLK